MKIILTLHTMLNMAPAGPYYYNSQTKIYQVDITTKNPMKIVNVNTFLACLCVTWSSLRAFRLVNR